MALFLTDIRNPGGKEYEPVSLQSFSNSIRKPISQVKSNVDEDNDFDTAKSVLKAKKKHLKQKGLGNTPNKAKVLSEEDEEILWNCGALGDGDPGALIHTVWFLLCAGLKPAYSYFGFPTSTGDCGKVVTLNPIYDSYYRNTTMLTM